MSEWPETTDRISKKIL